MIKAVLFDMDGVIIDSMPIHNDVYRQMFKEFGIDISQEELDRHTGMATRELWQDYKDKYNLVPTAAELVDEKSRRYLLKIHEDNEIKPIVGVTELMAELKKNGINIAVASSGIRKVVDAVVEKLELYKYVDASISGDDVVHGKPEPDIFLLAAEKLGVKPDECVVVEDANNGIRAAKRAGMKCIGIKNPGSGNQDLSMADIVINSFNEINAEKIKNI